MSTTRPPGPRGHWLAGSVPEFRRDMLGFLTRCAREYGDVAGFRLGPRRHVLVSHPDLVHKVLVTDNDRFARPYNYQLLRPTLGNGLLLNEGKAWLHQRRLMQPLFLRKQLLGYVAPTAEIARNFVACWHDGEKRDAHADMMRLTLDVVARVILGTDVAADARAIDSSLQVLQEDFKDRFETGLSLPAWLPTPANLRRRRAARALDAVIARMVAAHQSGAGGEGLLARLLGARDEEGAGMSPVQLRDELVTMLLAGHETTANTLAWALYLLASHPAVEEQVVREMEAVLGGRDLAADDLERLPFTEQVLLETMRLYPTAYMVGRKALMEVELGGFRLPAGTTLFLSQWVVHRDPRFFDRPEQFDPSRWAEGPRSLPGRAYFPFGAGPRLCIGAQFALVEATVLLATILPRYRLRLVDNAPVAPWPSVTLRPRGGLPVEVRRRDGLPALWG